MKVVLEISLKEVEELRSLDLEVTKDLTDEEVVRGYYEEVDFDEVRIIEEDKEFEEVRKELLCEKGRRLGLEVSEEEVDEYLGSKS